jgi:hypothetical protein
LPPKHLALDLRSAGVEKRPVDSDRLGTDRIGHECDDGSDAGVPAHGVIQIE